MQCYGTPTLREKVKHYEGSFFKGIQLPVYLLREVRVFKLLFPIRIKIISPRIIDIHLKISLISIYTINDLHCIKLPIFRLAHFNGTGKKYTEITICVREEVRRLNFFDHKYFINVPFLSIKVTRLNTASKYSTQICAIFWTFNGTFS